MLRRAKVLRSTPRRYQNRSEYFVVSPRTTTKANSSLPRDSRGARSDAPAWLAAVVLAIAVGLVYSWFLNVPLIFDDDTTIGTNDSIHSLWPLVGTTEHPGPLRTARGGPVSGRPLVSLSFALNYYFGELSPTGYHTVNVIIHFSSALLLWAIVRQTLRLPYFASRYDLVAGWLALAVSLIWALHPLQTEAVIYATQRTELMVAFFYLATLYCSLRYWSAGVKLPSRAVWLTLAIVASLAGMASKEVMVTAPIMVLLFERVFLTGSLASALRRSWPLYVGLAATWLLLLALNIGSPRGNTAGIGLGTPLATWWLTQSQVVLTYLKQVVWPWPLLIHYLLPYRETLAEAWMYALPVLLLGFGTLLLLWRNHPVGYLGVWVFAILSTTSIVPILTETAAERRMYLPLAALAVLLVMGGYRLLQLCIRRSKPLSGDKALLLTLAPALVLAIVLGIVSAKRLNAYYDPFHLWQDVVQYQPNNYIANINMGVALRGVGRDAEAIEYFQNAARLHPSSSDARSNLGFMLVKVGRIPEGISELQAALELKPDDPYFLHNLGLALMRTGRSSEGLEKLEQSVRIKPDYAHAHNSLGLAVASIGRLDRAREEFEIALSIDPGYENAHCNLANVFVSQGDIKNAIAQYESAVRVRPDFVEARYKLAFALTETGHPDQAIEHFEASMKLQPKNLQIYAGLAQAFAALHRSEEAVATARQGIEVARAANDENGLNQFEDWLKHYQTELRRAAETASPPSTPSQK
jgi:tetratricopeptide (TPR) repeat protein